MKPENSLLSILAPAYNEETNIERVILHWDDVISRYQLEAVIIVVNDGSTDRTGNILEGLKGAMSNLKVINSEKNLGYGGSLRAAIAEAAGGYALTIDSDGQFEFEDYKPMLKMLEGGNLDAVTGRREKKMDSFLLVAADRTLNAMVRILFGMPFKDTNCALKLYRMDTLRGLRLKGSGWSAPTELLIRAHKSGARIGEMVVRHYPRQAGESKLNPLGVGLRFFSFLVYLRLELSLTRQGKIRAGGE